MTYWNRAAEDLFRWPAEEALGRAAVELTIPAAEAPRAAEIRRALARGETWAGDFLACRKDGSTVRVRSTVSPLIDSRGKWVGTIAVSSDVTEQRERETRFHQSQKMEAIGRPAGGMAHDFNNLLTVIQGHVQLIREDLSPDSSMDEDLGQVLKEVGRAASLTRQLQEMVLNLAVNARDAIGEGGNHRLPGRGSKAHRSRSRSHSLDALPGEYACLVVEDDGSGMPTEVEERIFEPFFTTKPEGEGTGLGLSMVFGIVKQSGGHIVVESGPGRGARFDLLFPAVEGEVAEEDDEPLVARRPRREGRTGTILLVEDEASVRAVARRALERWGYRVIEARNGEEAVAAADDRGSEIDLVVSDIVMPEMGGSELVDRLRERIPGIPIVLMSGYSWEELAVGVRHKASAFLEKPFSPEDLARTVREALGG